MTAVSSPAMARAACENGAIGSFPAHNARDSAELGAWLTDATPAGGAPLAVNLVVHRTNPRLSSDLEVLADRSVEVVITSVGSPAGVVDAIHAGGGLVFADVATVRHAERALAAGADGLVLLTAGAGGQSGWLNPFAFVRAVRPLFDGPIAIAGGIADGVAVRAALMLGADLAYMGTRFIATTESAASDAYKRAVVDAGADDVVLTDRFTGLRTNLLSGWPGFEQPAAHGPDGSGFDQQRLLSQREAWSAGHGVGLTPDIVGTAELLAQLREEYDAAPVGESCEV